MKQISYSVTGMTCGGCVARVKKTLSQFAQNVEVTLTPPQAVLEGATANIGTMNAALSEVGQYKLSLLTTAPQRDEATGKSWLATYYPLLLILAFILLVSIGVQFSPMFNETAFDGMQWMMHFMAGFFLVFSFFKLLDIKGFANSYAMYDVLAMRVKAYGYVYPFIELGLGIAYLIGWQPILTNWMTLIVMLFSSIGVIRSVINQEKIRCACLGAVFNLPMSTVTIIEDLLMAGMALWMLL